jgi:nitronate monooxygenase
MNLKTALTEKLGIQVPILCGAMYPCSNPELIASASQAGAMGIIQPLSMVYVYKHSFRDGVRKIRALTTKPFGMNCLVEKSTNIYEKRMREWLDIALEEGCRFVVTALGNPSWVVERVHQVGGIVFHDVTERRWALKALDAGVDGLICVNQRAGGHAGRKSPGELFEELRDLGVPLVCAGGIGDEAAFVAALKMGYAGVQMGTRFIATKECAAHTDYKDAIVKADEKDIVLTERVTGIPLAVINTPYLERTGTRASVIGRWMLRNPRLKHWARLYYSLGSFVSLRRSAIHGYATKDFYQAGKSVAGIERVESVEDIVRRFESAALKA